MSWSSGVELNETLSSCKIWTSLHWPACPAFLIPTTPVCIHSVSTHQHPQKSATVYLVGDLHYNLLLKRYKRWQKSRIMDRIQHIMTHILWFCKPRNHNFLLWSCFMGRIFNNIFLAYRYYKVTVQSQPSHGCLYCISTGSSDVMPQLRHVCWDGSRWNIWRLFNGWAPLSELHKSKLWQYLTEYLWLMNFTQASTSCNTCATTTLRGIMVVCHDY